jgi:Domain of unknown function (DUF4136)
MRRTPLILLAAVVATTAMAQKVQVDYDKEFDFSEIKTISWVPGTLSNSEMNQKRLEAAIHNELEGKGLEWVEDGPEVDLYLVSHVDSITQTKSSNTSVGVGVSRRTRFGSVGVGTSTSGKPKEVTTGTVLIEMRDGTSEQLVWQGTASDTVKDTPDKNEKTINDAIGKLFKDFPPAPDKKKKK